MSESSRPLGSTLATGAQAVLLSAQKLTKIYHVQDKAEFRPVEVLKGVDIDIHRGEAICIMGASGAGKSTLLHILSSLDQPTQGRVIYHGRDLTQMNEDEIARFRGETVGFVFQFHNLLSDFTAVENVMMPYLVVGLGFDEARKKAEGLLVELGLKDRLEHRPSMLSGGEQQRVAVARALMRDPKIIFADEPTGNLDRQSGLQLQKLLFDLQRRRGMALVAVTHDQDFAKWFPKTRVLLDGRWR